MPHILTEERTPAVSGAAGGFIGQVTDHLTEDIVVVWDLDLHRRFNAYGVKSSDWPIGIIVSCTLRSDHRAVQTLSSVDRGTEEAYKSKRLLP